MRKLAGGEKRSAVIRCYLTPSEKKDAARLAKGADLSSSDLVRLLLIAATPEQALRLAVDAERLLPSGKA
jgi:hypothetical protein